MYYPRFTKVIIHHFMSKDPSIPRRNKVNWHYIRDNNMFSTIKLVSRHQNKQQFGALLPIELTNEEIKKSNAYKEYYAIAIGAAPPKPKASVWKTRSSFDTSITPPSVIAGLRLTASAKGKQVAKAFKAKCLSALSEVAMTEAQQLKLVTKRSMQQTIFSQASGFGADEGTGSISGVPDVPTDESEEELSWNSTDDEGDNDEGKDGDDDEEDEGDDGEEGDGDDDDEDDDGEEGNDDDDDQEVKRDDDKDDEEEGGDDEQEYDDEEYDEEMRDDESFNPIPKTPEDSDDDNGEEDLELNVGREEGHNEEADDLYRNVNINQGRGIQATLEVKDSHVTLTPVNPDGQQQSSSVSSQFVTSVLNPTLDVAPSTIIQDLSNFGSLFRFDNRLRTLEANFFEFRQTNQFAGAVSSILGIINRYMDQRMNEAVKVAVQIQSDRLRNEAQKENDEFLKTVDENMQKIIKGKVKEQVKVQVSKILPRIEQDVNEQLEAEVLTRSSHSSKTSYAVATDLFEMELKKILIEKMEGNKMNNPPLDQTGGQRDTEKERILSQQALQRKQLPGVMAGTHKGLDLDRRADDQPIVQPSQHPEWFSQQQKPPTPDRDWNKTLPAVHRSIQPWISELAKQTDSRSSFNELMDTPLDFSNFLINRLKVDTLTPKLLAGPIYELMNGSCKSLAELEYHLEEVFKAITDQLDWVNPEGQQHPHNLLQPLPLIPNNQGHRVIPFEHFINNDLEYLRGGASSHKYTTFLTKTKAADYGHIKWIEDLVPRTIWIEEPIGYSGESLIGGVKVSSSTALLLTESLLRRVEDLQLGVENYQKKLNLTKPDTYRSDLKHKEAYTTYSNPRGFIY
uniref:Uncharacterized protein n=1 Tax=Tanacetum cinerariifolium TaxID=118510 RepID=A0A6L2ND34_TANCI|nr:hypothetical protein [Tanacetum cinerariifolium]